MEIIDLEMIPGGPKKTCHASQFDNGRVIRFNLKENGQPFALSGTETVKAIIRKPDGTEKTVNIANTASTYVDLITAEDTCDLAGVNHCEMKVTEDGEDLGSGNFDMKVEEDAYNGGDVSVGTASGPIASFETDIKDDLIECVCDIVATGGNGTPDNPNPINGYSSANITRCGVNLFNITTTSATIRGVDYTINSDGTFTANGTATGGYSQITLGKISLPAGDYVMSDEGNFDRNNDIELYIGGVPSSSTKFLDNRSFTLTSPLTNVNVFFFVGNGKSINTTIKPMIRPSVITDTTYHPYNGQTYTIAFGQTVYGGQLIITPDRTYIHVTWGSVDLGSLDIAYTYPLETYRRFQVTMPDNYKRPSNTSEYTDLLCSIYKADLNAISGNPNEIDLIMAGYVNDSNVYIVNHSYTDANAFKTAMSGVMLAYPLATPFDIDLTPVQIETLLGQKNNVYHNANGNTAVKFYIRA